MATWTALRLTSQDAGLSTKGVETTTDSAPASGAQDGQILAGIGGFVLFVEADSGQTLSGTGNLLAYYWDEFSDWARAPDMDIAIPATVAGQRYYAAPSPAGLGWTVANPRGRIAHITSGVGVSGGGVTLKYCVTVLKGQLA